MIESWLNTTINNGEVLPANYTIYRHDRDTRGGGVLIAVLNKIPSKQIVIDCELDIILVQLEILPRILVCCVYNPPSSSDDHFNRLLDLIHSLPVHGDVLILGDFNVPDVDWDTLSASTSRSSSLCDCIFENNLIQMVTGGTHCHGNTLDLILTNSPGRVTNVLIDNKLISDHHRIYFDVEVSRLHESGAKTITLIDCFSRADLMGLDSHLLDVDFGELLRAVSVDDCNSQLKNEIIKASRLFVPQVRIPSNPSLPWFSAEIRHNCKRARSARRQVQQNPTPARKMKLALIEQNLQNQIATSKEYYITNLVSSFSSDPGKLFRYLNCLGKSSTCILFLGPNS